MDLREYKDVEFLVSQIVEPLQHIAGSLAEIQANSEAILANGVDIKVTIHIGGKPDD